MKLARRGVALLLQVLLLHVSVLGGGAACVERLLSPSSVPTGTAALVAPAAEHAARSAAHHGQHHGPAGTPEGGGPSMPAGGDHAPDQAPSHAPGDGPHGMTHCGTMPACGAIALASTTTELPAVWSSAGRAQVAQFDAPRSTTAAPEPPPPRA
ncbi:MAG: hypothetical protein ACJ79S_17935 [Gemmatimonadaceae bacterium]